MSNALVPVGDNLPAHIAARLGKRQNIAPPETVPSLTFPGKVWTVNVGGESTQILREVDGEMTPAQVFRVVILDWARDQGRALYGKTDDASGFQLTTYDPKKPARPLCYSDDGISADSSVKSAPFEGWTGKCDTCPMSRKGSKITDNGVEATACAKHRMIAVIPHNQLNGTPLRMKLATTSDWDARSPDLAAQGWFAFRNFVKDLQAKGYTDTAMFVTKLKFDPNANYPKVVFHYDRWLSEGEQEVVDTVADSPFVKNLLAGNWTPNGADGVRKDPPDEESPPLARPAPKALAKPQPAQPVALPVVDEDEDEEDAAPPPRPAPKAAVKPVAKPKPAQPVAPVFASKSVQSIIHTSDEDEEDVPPPARPAPKAAKPKPAQTAVPVEASREVPSEIAKILGQWDPASTEDDE